jgi:putative DNA primase/helicase
VTSAHRTERMLPRKNNVPALSLVSLDEVAVKDISWCWPGRIPRGMVTLIAGYPKSGKSLVACKIAAIVTKGGKFPHNEGQAKRGHVIIINNEDDVQQIQMPRLLAAGADRKRIHTPTAQSRSSSAEAFLYDIDQAIEKIDHPRAVILDPLTSVVAVSRNNADEVRNFLNALNLLAAKHKIAVIVVAHLTKSTHGRSIFQVAGSFEWIAACRATFLVTENPGRRGEHLFLNLASNLSLKRDGLAFRIKVGEAKNGASAPSIAWKKKTVTLSAEEVLTASPKKRSETTNEAVRFLRTTILQPTRATEVLKLGKAAGFTPKELRTAREVLGMKSERVGGLGAHGEWMWTPAGERSSSE